MLRPALRLVYDFSLLNRRRKMMRIYICAAAKDMAAERELMHSYVLPELNDRLGEQGIEVVADDPRAADDYLSLSAAERAAEALDRIDRARPWFVAFVGDAVDATPVALPADVLAQHPWLAQQQGASVLELELLYGALEGAGERKPIVYLRDDRFLRDVPLAQRSDYSSEDLSAVARLETLKTRLRESGVRLVDGYHCRWDAAAGRVNDLDELGKQVIEDLYEAILQVERPEMQIGVLDELPASGAAMGMVNQAGEGPPRVPAPGEVDDDMNFDIDEVLDIDAGLSESSSASAIEGVEPLDFLEDDDDSAAPPPMLDPTVNFDAVEYAADDDVNFDLADEVLDVDEVEAADEAQFDDEPIDEIISVDEAISSDGPLLATPVDEDEVVDVDIQAMFDDEPRSDLSDLADNEPPPAASAAPESPSPAFAPPEFAAAESAPPKSVDRPAESPGESAGENEGDIDGAEEIVEPALGEDDAEELLVEPIANVPDGSADQPVAEATMAGSLGADDASPVWVEPVAAADATADVGADAQREMETAASEGSGDDEFAAFLDEPTLDEAEAAAASEAAGAVEDDETGWNFDDAEAGDERTVRHSSEPTEVSDAGDDAPPLTAAAVDKVDQQDSSAATVAPVVSSSLASSRQPKKKSSLPLIVAALLLLLLVGGAAGAYFAGLIPGLGGTGANVAENTPTPPPNPAAEDYVKRINENEAKLTELYRAAKPASGEIDTAKIEEAQALIAQLEASDPEVAAEEPIQAHKTRFATLAADAKKQVAANVEQQRRDDFRKALELAGANAPMSLDQGYLNDARRLAANKRERNLIAALEQQVQDYADEQARLAAENAGAARQKALAAIAAATGDAEDYRAAIEAFLAAVPEDVAANDLQAALESEPATLDAVHVLNKLAADWAKLDMRKLTAAEAQQQLDAASAATARTAALPGAAAIAQRADMLTPMAMRGKVPLLSGGAIQAPLILGMKDGKRYYLTAKPAAKDGKLIATYVSDLADRGATAEAEIVAAEIDRTTSAPSTLPATAKLVNEALAAAEAAWEPAFLKALMIVQADAKMDPVVKTQWLLMLAEVGSQGSRPLADALGDFSKLAATGVDANFNWADPAAAAEVREKCAAAIAALPQARSIAKPVAAAYNELAAFSIPPAPVTPVGVLLSNADDPWTVQLAEVAPQSATLIVLSADTADAPLAATNIGSIEAGEAVLDDDADKSGWIQGRVVYAMTSAETGN